MADENPDLHNADLSKMLGEYTCTVNIGVTMNMLGIIKNICRITMSIFLYTLLGGSFKPRSCSVQI